MHLQQDAQSRFQHHTVHTLGIVMQSTANQSFFKIIAFTIPLILSATTSLAAPHTVRVVNASDSRIYIHPGGYASAVTLKPKQARSFSYPFIAHPPNGKGRAVKSSLLVATAGGRWVKEADGYTYLRRPQMVVCLDYRQPTHQHKTGYRLWTIRQASGFDSNCRVQPFPSQPFPASI